MDFDPRQSDGFPPVQVWTVSELNRVVKDVLEQSLQPFWVRGEIGNLTIHRSGHVYFSLKDSRCQLSAVFFRGAGIARDLGLETGLEVEVWGRASIYEPRGQFQMIVNQVRTKGLGALQREFEQLKTRLRDEGLFDEERKRPIPMLPRCVGVVTSPDGAAIRDFMQILGRRFATMHVRICPSAVQGAQAAGQIAGGVQFLNESKACDVIVVTRGGGSLEDLWPFNEEIVARAIAASEIPVISAVGHERDFTICDFCADLRVPTPSAAAELVIARKSELLDRVAQCCDRLDTRLRLRLADMQRRLERAVGSLVVRDPSKVVQMHQQRVDELALRLPRALSRRLERCRARLEHTDAKLSALNPRGVLGRGYTILMDAEKKHVLRTAQDTAPGAKLRGILADGELALTVDAVSEEIPAAPEAEETLD